MIWAPFAINGVVTGLVCWALAAFIYRTTPAGKVRFWVTALLLFEGMQAIGNAGGPVVAVTSREMAEAGWMLHFVNDGLLLMVYLPLLAALVDSRLVNWAGRMPGLLVPLAVGGGIVVGTLLFPKLSLAELVPFHPTLDADYEANPDHVFPDWVVTTVAILFPDLPSPNDVANWPAAQRAGATEAYIE